MNDAILQSLAHPDRYPGSPSEVHLVQTHLSVVCIAGEDVYKLKKPVKLPFVDFSTPSLREHCCHEEVRLNRRLCPDIYRGVVPLYRAGDAWTFCEEPGAEVADHAVLMRRLPEERMMDVLLKEDGGVSVRDVQEIARIVAAFHGEAERGPDVLDAGHPDRLAGFALDNFSETEALTGEIFDAQLHARLRSRTESDFAEILPILRARRDRGLVVDGHGDLHARNICLSDPVAIYDCIEFNAGFRCGDVATENAFLVMDLIYRGHRELAAAYLDAYVTESGDAEQRSLMPVLVRYRAMVRAKVSALVAGESEVDESDRDAARESARRHAHLAAASLIDVSGPRLVLACGLPASGKTTVFRQLTEETRWRCLASDRIRKELAGVAPTDALPEPCYTSEFSDRTYDELIRRGVDEALERRAPVLLDANFRSAEKRARAVAAARDANLPIAVVFFDIDDETVAARMEQRRRESGGVSDADWEVYRELKTTFEPPRAGEGFALCSVSGAAPVSASISRLLAVLLED